jgi:hypothetical protein
MGLSTWDGSPASYTGLILTINVSLKREGSEMSPSQTQMLRDARYAMRDKFLP